MLALLAFGYQSYVTQTHVHLTLAPATSKMLAAAGTDTKGVAAHRSTPEKLPANDEPVKCPLCQAVGYAGHFVMPAAATSLLPSTVAVSILPLWLLTPSFRQTLSHSWQGRGPPTS